MKKVCRKCGKLLDISKFYQHPQMKDGHLNICIDCVKERVRKHRIENIEAIRAYDRIRGRSVKRTQVRMEYIQTLKQKDPERYNQMMFDKQRKYRQKYREKDNAHLRVARALRSGVIKRPEKCSRCGATCKPEAHHHDYSKPLEVVWLCNSCHSKEHHLSVEAYASKYRRTEA